MAIHRIYKDDSYFVMSNYHFREKEMSLKAKGLLSLMLSLPDEWTLSLDVLAALSKDSKRSVAEVLKELEKFGYVKKCEAKSGRGKITGYFYNVYEKPTEEAPEQKPTHTTTIREYANEKKITYEAVRLQVAKYRDSALKDHIFTVGRTQLLDDYAVEFLDQHRRNAVMVVNGKTYSIEEIKQKLASVEQKDNEPTKRQKLTEQEKKEQRREYQREYAKRYRAEHGEELKAYRRAYRLKNKDKINQQHREWVNANQERYNSIQLNYYRRKNLSQAEEE